MKTSYKLLVEQAWELQENLTRCIEIDCKRGVAKRRSERHATLTRIELLENARTHAQSRYLRRLKKLWETQVRRPIGYLA